MDVELPTLLSSGTNKVKRPFKPKRMEEELSTTANGSKYA
jgi:hypothetical protein